MLVTFVVCLLVGVELGILVGVGVNIALLLIYSARPKIVTCHLQVVYLIRVNPCVRDLILCLISYI